MEPKFNLLLSGGLGQTQVVVMAVALAVFCAGFLLGALWHRWGPTKAARGRG